MKTLQDIKEAALKIQMGAAQFLTTRKGSINNELLNKTRNDILMLRQKHQRELQELQKIEFGLEEVERKARVVKQTEHKVA